MSISAHTRKILLTIGRFCGGGVVMERNALVASRLEQSLGDPRKMTVGTGGLP